MRHEGKSSHLWMGVGAACLAAVLVADVRWPIGAVIGHAYVIVALSAFFISARDAIVLATLATTANVVGYAVAPSPPIPEWIVAASRGASVFTTWLMIVTGIHFHKQSQTVIATIRRSNDRWRLALEGAELAFWDLDVAANRFTVDEEWVRRMGYPAADASMSVERLESLVHPDDLPLNRQRWHDHVEGRTPRFEVEQRFRSSDGSWRHLVTKGRVIARDESGRVLRVSGTHLDVTEAYELKEKAEQAQRDRLEELQLLANAIPMVIGYIDAEKRVQFANVALERAYDLPTRDIQGARLADLVGAEAYSRIERHIKAVLDGRRVQFEDQVVRSDGVWFWLFQFLPRTDPSGAVIGFYSLMTDITGLKRSQAEVDLQREAVALFNRRGAANEMAAALAHEMNQPLGTIAVYSGRLIELLEADRASRNEIREVMELIKSEALRAGQVVKRARMLVDDRPIQPVMVDAAQLLESIQRICGAKAAIERVAIETRVQSNAAAIYGDRVQLQQVLVNLVSNAIDASAGLPEQRKRVLVTAEVDATGARLSVSDLGTGLSGGDNDRVFRAHYTTKRDGLGIGLNVAHSIVTTHGGKLWVTPNGGPGATFYVTLPPPPVDDLLATTTEKLPLLSENP